MEGNSPRGNWATALTMDEIRAELEKLGLSMEGADPTLRERLRRYIGGNVAGAEIPRTPRSTDRLRVDASRPEPLPLLPDSPGLGEGAAGESQWWWDTSRDADRRRPPRLELPPRAEPYREPRRSRPSPSDICNIMRKWNISFSGAPGSDAETFLQRIEEGRQIVPVTDDDLFACLPLFLSGVALTWYRMKRSMWRDWRDFETAWRRRFGDPDFQYALRVEVLRRTQGEHESVADYLTNMQALLCRLSPRWSLAEELSQAHRNMLPRLQTSIHRREFRDFDELEDLAIRVERGYLAASAYRPPPAPESSIFPDLAYRAPKKAAKAPVNLVAAGLGDGGASNNSRGNRRARARAASGATAAAAANTAGPATVAAATGGESSEAGAAAAVSTPSTGRCWNCGKEGHRARDCTAERRVHCYRCGRVNVTVKTCPSCAGNGARNP